MGAKRKKQNKPRIDGSPHTRERYVANQISKWAEFSKGGGPGSSGSLWPEKFYKGGRPTGQETAIGKQSPATFSGRTQEWPDDVIVIDRLVGRIVRQYPRTGREIARTLRVCYGTDEAREVQARMLSMSVRTMDRRRETGFSLINQWLP